MYWGECERVQRLPTSAVRPPCEPITSPLSKIVWNEYKSNAKNMLNTEVDEIQLSPLKYKYKELWRAINIKAGSGKYQCQPMQIRINVSHLMLRYPLVARLLWQLFNNSFVNWVTRRYYLRAHSSKIIPIPKLINQDITLTLIHVVIVSIICGRWKLKWL